MTAPFRRRDTRQKRSDQGQPSSSDCRVANRAVRTDMLVIHVNVGFRPGYVEISSRNKLFTMLKGSGLVTPGSDAMRIHSNLVPLKSEAVVVKHQIRAFSG